MKIEFKSEVFVAKDKTRIEKAAEKFGLVLPSKHTALFQSPLSPIDKPNNNGHELTAEAVNKSLDKIKGSQANINHNGKNWMCGVIYDAWINEANEVEVIFSFAKNIYQEEYIIALEKLNEGKLSISWEITADTETMEKLPNNVYRIHSFDWDGIGVLIGKKPGYSGAVVSKMAELYKQRAKESEKELIFAEQIIKDCDEILNQDTCEDETEDSYILSEQEIADFVAEWQHKMKKNKKQKSKKKYSEHEIKTKENSIMTEEQKKLVAGLRAELEGFIPAETTDEQLLDEKVVAEFRSAKEKSAKAEPQKVEAKESKEAEVEVAKEKVSAESKRVSNERYITETTYKDDGSTETKHAKECTYTWMDENGVAQTEVVKTAGVEYRLVAEADAKETEAKVAASETKIKDLEATIEAQKVELDTFKAEKAAKEAEEKAQKLAEIKASLKDNKYVADFKDEDYFSAEKVEKAKLLQRVDNLEAENKALKEKEPKEEIQAEAQPTTQKVHASLETGVVTTDEKPVSVRKIINKACKA